MKRLLPYLIVALFLVACGKKVEIIEPPFVFDNKLLHIDSLMQHDADSALQTLLSFRAERGTSYEFNANYQSLLISEALYKTYNPQLNRYRCETFQETSLQDAMHYFDSLAMRYPNNDDITMLSARSHYMNGVGYYENDSVVEACKEYLHALEIMEGHFDEKDLVGYKAKFMGLTYTRLGELFFDNGVKKASVEMYQTAIKYFEKVDGFCLANPIRSLALAFALNDQTDSAVFCYREAIDLAKKHNKHSVLGKCLSELAPIYYDLGYKDSAFIMARESMRIPSNAEILLIRYFVYGEMLTKECQYDSAIYYLDKSINSDNLATKTVSAELLMKCHMALGDTAKIQYYKSVYGEKLDNYRYIMTNENELTNIYESYKHEKLQIVHIKNIRRQIVSLIIVSLFLISIVIWTLILIRKRIISIKKKSQDDIERKNKALVEMKRKIEANPFINEPICKSILEITHIQQFKSKVNFNIYKEYALSKEQMLLLRDAADRHYNNFTQRLQYEYPELTYDDIDYCCLYLLGLKDADVSAFKQRSYRAVCDRNKKLKHIFKTKLTVSIFLNNLVNDCFLD